MTAVEESAERIAVIHPTGNMNVRMTLEALDNARRLAVFVTSFGFSSAQRTSAWVPKGLAKELEKRRYSIPSKYIRQRRREEVWRNILLKSPSRALRRSAEPWERFGVDWVSRAIDVSFARSLVPAGGIGAVLGYQGTSLQTFRRAQQVGLPRVLEVTHAHWATTERIYRASIEREPEWATTVSFPTARGRDAADEQLELASIVMTPSEQVTESVASRFPHLTLIENPYGCPPVSPEARPRKWDGRGRLKVLFVGRLTSGKGVAAMAQAAQALQGRIDLTAIGARPNVESEALTTLIDRIDYRGPLPRTRVLDEMAKAHIFVLPSLVEGRSLAALEAISSGLPLIVTPGSGVSDLAAQGAGRVVPNGDGESLTAAIEHYLNDPGLVAIHSEAALAVASRNGWDGYKRRVAELDLRRVT